MIPITSLVIKSRHLLSRRRPFRSFRFAKRLDKQFVQIRETQEGQDPSESRYLSGEGGSLKFITVYKPYSITVLLFNCQSALRHKNTPTKSRLLPPLALAKESSTSLVAYSCHKCCYYNNNSENFNLNSTRLKTTNSHNNH